MTWIAALPMYNVTPALAAGWQALLADVLRDIECAVKRAVGSAVEPTDMGSEPFARIVEPDDDLPTLWRRPNLLLSQTCGYPLMQGLHREVQLIATPQFDVPGCVGVNYSSVLVARAQTGYDSLEQCRGARAAFNQPDSNSGYNAFRHAVAPLARDGRFFGATLCTGSHVGSIEALAANRADVAAIDCVTMAYLRDARPDLTREVREIGWTQASPGLPLVAAASVPANWIDALRQALNDALAARPERARQLRINGFKTLTLDDYAPIVQMEEAARVAGYPRLA